MYKIENVHTKIIVDVILIALIALSILMYKDAFKAQPEKTGADTDEPKPGISLDTDRGKKILLLLCIVIAIMAPISSIGTNNNLYVEYCRDLDLLAQRSFYAVGLIAAGFIFDKNRTVGGICSIVSLIYPLVLVMIYHESGNVKLVIGLSYVILGFFAVYRAASFMSLATATKKLQLAPLGLAVARICEALMVLIFFEFNFNELTTIILMSILFIPLIIFFMLMVKEEYGFFETPAAETRVPGTDERRAAFAKLYGLTRREEQITQYLSEGLANGEIADALQLSESTVRFHVSNILKKTGMKDRNEVGRVYRM